MFDINGIGVGRLIRTYCIIYFYFYIMFYPVSWFITLFILFSFYPAFVVYADLL